MKTEIQILDPTDKESIITIANWYNSEWGTPLEKTFNRLSKQPNEDVLVQMILLENRKLVSTVGLCYKVNLLDVHPHFADLGPWLALLYTDEDYRNKGYGKRLLDQIESYARDNGLDKIYLYTFTAEALYRRSAWKPIAAVKYKGYDTKVMEKSLIKD